MYVLIQLIGLTQLNLGGSEEGQVLIDLIHTCNYLLLDLDWTHEEDY